MDLGEFHECVKHHIRKLIDSPDCALSGDPQTGSFNGVKWEHPKLVEALLTYAKDMPYLTVIFCAFMEGSLEKWEDFTREFEAGGEIDWLDGHGRSAAWMPATNDHNEGALGSLCQILRQKPRIKPRHQ